MCWARIRTINMNNSMFASQAEEIIYSPLISLSFRIKMRVLVRAIIPTTAGNKMVQDPNLLKDIEDYIKKFNCEASYILQ
jgi:hypothetical protein